MSLLIVFTTTLMDALALDSACTRIVIGREGNVV